MRRKGEHRTVKSYNAETCMDNLKQYLTNSTLHGLRYVGENSISPFERIFFGLSFVLVVMLSIYYISNIYEKWSSTPIIVALSAVSTSINDIPFPAVTICNMNQARQSVVRDFKEGTYEDALLQSLCAKHVTFNGIRSNYTSWAVFQKFLVKVSQPCNEMLTRCSYASYEIDCMTLFNTVLTDEGLCCIFNRVHPKFLLKKFDAIDEFDLEHDDDDIYLTPVDWTPESGFGGTQTRVLPRPGSGTGSNMGLTVLLNVNVSDYHCSTTNSAGFKVLLHNPTETPKIADYGVTVTPGHENRIVVSPRISDASSLIKKVPISQRRCVFSHEGNLTYFRTYSRKNCEMECESRMLIEQCGCVLYYMPRVNEKTNICNRDDWMCYEKIKRAIEMSVNDTYECHCLPGCFELSYGGDISTARLGTEGFMIKQNIIKKMGTTEFITKNIASLHVYYEESFFRSNSKEEFIGFTEFLSNTGGLLGLFMGFSVVSLIEILYFITIRPYCAASKKRSFQRVDAQTDEVDDVAKGKTAAIAQTVNIQNVEPWPYTN